MAKRMALCDRRGDAEFYVVRAEGEWAFISIHEPTGTFMSTGSFGTFAYTWSHHGCDSLKAFLAGFGTREFDYFFSKTDEGRRGRAFDFDDSILGLRERIIDRRRQASISGEFARECWDSVDNIEAEGRTSRDRFASVIYDDSTLYRLLSGDLDGVCRDKRDPQCDGFWTKLWPAFLAQALAEASGLT